MIMDRSMAVFSDMTLSFNGETITINAEDDRITVSSPSIRSGLRALLGMDEHHDLSTRSAELSAMLADLGWTLYAHAGIFNLAILGLKARRGLFNALFVFGRIGRMIGVV